jgi:hypothetical protein
MAAGHTQNRQHNFKFHHSQNNREADNRAWFGIALLERNQIKSSNSMYSN